MGHGIVHYIFQRPRFCFCLPVRIGVAIMSFLGILLSGLLSIVLWFEASRAHVFPYILCPLLNARLSKAEKRLRPSSMGPLLGVQSSKRCCSSSQLSGTFGTSYFLTYADGGGLLLVYVASSVPSCAS